jgi:hypothetical protein
MARIAWDWPAVIAPFGAKLFPLGVPVQAARAAVMMARPKPAEIFLIT